MESKWYTVKVVSNREKEISEKLKYEVQRSGLTIKTLLPTERIYFAKNGKKTHREKVIYPGYIFVESESLAILQDVLKLIPGNSGILRSKTGEPSFLRKEEIDKMLNETENPKSVINMTNFVIGETIMIVGGPFDKFKGDIEEINKDKGKVKVNVLIFGRSTRVDLNIEQIEKVIE
jgi:transcription termination/antitermination protein NusG